MWSLFDVSAAVLAFFKQVFHYCALFTTFTVCIFLKMLCTHCRVDNEATSKDWNHCDTGSQEQTQKWDTTKVYCPVYSQSKLSTLGVKKKILEEIQSDGNWSYIGKQAGADRVWHREQICTLMTQVRHINPKTRRPKVKRSAAEDEVRNIQHQGRK